MSLWRSLCYRWASLSGRKAARQRAAQAAFETVCAGMGKGDMAVDLGANAGIYTLRMAATGAHVVAIEPDPFAFDMLRDRVGHAGNVTLLPVAAGTSAGQMTLHRTANFEQDPARHTTSSSLLADKKNVAGGQGMAVEVIDIVAYLTDLNRDIALMKVDIEGAEVAVMEALLDAPVAQRIGHIFVETHARSIPRLADRTDALRARTQNRARPKVNWDWH